MRAVAYRPQRPVPSASVNHAYDQLRGLGHAGTQGVMVVDLQPGKQGSDQQECNQQETAPEQGARPGETLHGIRIQCPFLALLPSGTKT